MKRLTIIVAIIVWSSSGARAAEHNLFQQAVNYVFTGSIDPKDDVEISDPLKCIVVLHDTKVNRYIRYYLLRFNMTESRFNQIYAGRQALNSLEVQGDEILIEYLDRDKETVMHGYKSAQIQLPGDLEQTKKAISIIFSKYCRADQSKTPF